MHHRPKILWGVAAGLVATGLAMPFQVFYLYEYDLREIFEALDKLTFLNWLVFFGSLACSVLVFHASAWVRYAVPGLIAIVALNNLAVGLYATDYSSTTAHLATFAFVLLNFPLLYPPVLQAILKPDRCWWKMAPRKTVSVPILLESRTVSLKTETFDVSSSGVFIPWDGLMTFKAELPINVCMNLGPYRQFRCSGRIVRRAQARGKYPNGIGIQFEGLAWPQRVELNKYLSSANGISARLAA